MSLPDPGSVPLLTKHKKQVRTQLGALCYRVKAGKPEVLMVTTRGSGRWLIPRGWPVAGRSPGGAALQEAWEEAGVVGKLAGNAIGIYSYMKGTGRGRMPCIVAVFPVRVKRLEDAYPEAGQRKRKWMSPRKAASRVLEPELRDILRGFDPARLGD